MRPSFIVIILYYYSCFENTIEIIKMQQLIRVKRTLIEFQHDLLKRYQKKRIFEQKKIAD